jgi:hypothetical protein
MMEILAEDGLDAQGAVFLVVVGSGGPSVDLADLHSLSLSQWPDRGSRGIQAVKQALGEGTRRAPQRALRGRPSQRRKRL